MIRLSVNVLHRTVSVLSAINDFEVSMQKELIDFFDNDITTDYVLKFASECKWISVTGNCVSLTERGKQIISIRDELKEQSQYRILLEDYLSNIKPIWASKIPYGRKETTLFMTKDELACFFEAGLLDDAPSFSVVRWWDNISSIIRNEKNDDSVEVGREGELYTIKYEINRTKKHPEWHSIDSNLSGYDILSYTDKDENDQLLIEVKTTESNIENGYFYVTNNEWTVSRLSDNYLFYLWIINDNECKLAIVSSDSLSKHIPVDQSDGKWQSVRIPFLAFQDKFCKINKEELNAIPYNLYR